EGSVALLDNVFRRGEKGIDDTAPRPSRGGGGDHELQLLRPGVAGQIEVAIARRLVRLRPSRERGSGAVYEAAVQAASQGGAEGGEIRLEGLYAVPDDVGRQVVVRSGATKKGATPQGGVRAAQRDHQAGETQERFLDRAPLPVDPAGRIVLAPGVVVAVL